MKTQNVSAPAGSIYERFAQDSAEVSTTDYTDDTDKAPIP